MGNIVVNSTLLERIKKTQEKDTDVQKWVEKVRMGDKTGFNLGSNGILIVDTKFLV